MGWVSGRTGTSSGAGPGGGGAPNYGAEAAATEARRRGSNALAEPPTDPVQPVELAAAAAPAAAPGPGGRGGAPCGLAGGNLDLNGRSAPTAAQHNSSYVGAGAAARPCPGRPLIGAGTLQAQAGSLHNGGGGGGGASASPGSLRLHGG